MSAKPLENNNGHLNAREWQLQWLGYQTFSTL
jgi:hypothetical protein